MSNNTKSGGPAFSHDTAISLSVPYLQSSDIILDVLETREGTIKELLQRTQNINAPNSEVAPSGTVTSTRENRQLFIMLTGNPGIVAFYRNFASYLATQADKFIGGKGKEGSHVGRVKLDVVVIGFAGHSTFEAKYLSNQCPEIHIAPRTSAAKVPGVPKRKYVFSVPEQSVVFNELIKSIFNPSESSSSSTDPSTNASLLHGYRRVYLGGHSCSTYTALPVVAKYPHLFTRYFMLAPTINDLIDSPQAKKDAKWMFSSLFMNVAWLLLTILYMITTAKMRKRIVVWAKPKLQAHLQSALADSLTPSITYSALSLGKSEMVNIGPLNRKINSELYPSDKTPFISPSMDTTAKQLATIKDKLVIWCPQRDHWAPLSYYRRICAALGVTPKSDEDIKKGPTSKLSDRDVMASTILGETTEAASGSAEGMISPDNAKLRTEYTLPLVDVVNDPKFSHGWSTHYSFTSATQLVLPYMLA